MSGVVNRKKNRIKTTFTPKNHGVLKKEIPVVDKKKSKKKNIKEEKKEETLYENLDSTKVSRKIDKEEFEQIKDKVRMLEVQLKDVIEKKEMLSEQLETKKNRDKDRLNKLMVYWLREIENNERAEEIAKEESVHPNNSDFEDNIDSFDTVLSAYLKSKGFGGGTVDDSGWELLENQLKYELSLERERYQELDKKVKEDRKKMISQFEIEKNELVKETEKMLNKKFEQRVKEVEKEKMEAIEKLKMELEEEKKKKFKEKDDGFIRMSIGSNNIKVKEGDVNEKEFVSQSVEEDVERVVHEEEKVVRREPNDVEAYEETVEEESEVFGGDKNEEEIVDTNTIYEESEKEDLNTKNELEHISFGSDIMGDADMNEGVNENELEEVENSSDDVELTESEKEDEYSVEEVENEKEVEEIENLMNEKQSLVSYLEEGGHTAKKSDNVTFDAYVECKVDLEKQWVPVRYFDGPIENHSVFDELMNETERIFLVFKDEQAKKVGNGKFTTWKVLSGKKDVKFSFTTWDELKDKKGLRRLG